MKTMGHFLCAAILMVAGMAVSEVSAQSFIGRALFAYPMQGQTPEQENADRAACHDWAVQQTGFDPTTIPEPAPRQGGGVLAGRAINAQPGPTGSGRGVGSGPGGMGGAMSNAEIRRINELYDAYLRAGQSAWKAEATALSDRSQRSISRLYRDDLGGRFRR